MMMSTPQRLLRSAALGLSVLLAIGTASMAVEGATVLPDRTRVASVGGSITEIVYALGEEGALIARDSTSVYPEAVFKLPDVGYMRALSPEGVLSVNPTGILALEGSGPKEAIDVLKKASVPYIQVPEGFSHDGILQKIRIVGKALGTDAKAEALAADVGKQLSEAEALTKDIAQGERKRVLFILSMQGGKILASGNHTAADGIIALAGAVNAVEGYPGYKQLTDEAAITARPDVILMMDRGGGTAVPDDELFAHPAIASTPAGQARRVIRMDGAYLLGFGPRTAAAIKDLAVALYGDAVKK
ncbi:ABC transporter substrate-binding protein [Aminobacter sp. MDW-2]|uniref:heme/hemin ABC transporter substrate-binding protein n=1 Tax=Aminobacter sp. MDW-2 TaxID=2666139 RepID=UPI0012B03E34|nr:ABC transporter substrate-binding protein [Aminobacter sp. MDW-2]MRX31599.1 ABC transporter substrate-binding protein [Aminobacter sp. MDW-2]QNH32092.1 ABC transporter substrate-binding protein [Aminobacter sp. MDW-2]